MSSLDTRHTIISSLVPENPKNGQIFKMPEGQVLGASNLLTVYKDKMLLGNAERLTVIPNVSGKATLERVTTGVPLRKGMRIRVSFDQYSYSSAIFVQFFGWVGHDVVDIVKNISDSNYRIEHALQIGPASDKFFVYEKICLTHTEGK